MRRIRPNLPESYEDLVANYYGRRDPRTVVSIEDVVRNYYGHTVSASSDDGEVLGQPPPPLPADGFEEYVAGDAPPSPPAAVAAAPPPPPAPAPPAPPAPPAAGLPAAPPPAPAPPAAAPHEAQVPEPQSPPAPAAEPAAPASAEAESLSDDDKVDEAQLAADLEAILSGKKVYEPGKGMVERDGASAAQPPTPPTPDSPPPQPAANDQHAIFDRIAQSMEYANAYDLGEVELRNRFARFDQDADLLDRAGAPKATPQPEPLPEILPAEPTEPTEPAHPTVGGADFLEDLDALREAAEASGADAVRRAAAAMPKSGAPAFARPMYYTGEHVLAGGDLYEGQLHVGGAPGVAFSYGQLMAMGDLYDSVDQMLDADPAELEGLKTLVQTSMQSSAQSPVTEEQWEAATNNRYLRLAEDNYEHFAPNTLFADAIASAANQRGDHRSAWEAHHRRAIQEAQKLALDPANAQRSYVPEWPLTINAFGDHFLTDAFASGHLFNKAVMVAYFRAGFFAGGSLNPAGEAFFQRVAEAAFVGDVREQFSALETVDYPVCIAGWCLRWHPNINSVERFRGLLVEAARQQPERVANLAVMALHDRLNRDGIEVTNAAGDPAWTLTGDVHLNPTTLAIMQKAVRQSADDITDPSIRASNLDFGPYLERVWRYVPQLTPASKQTVTDLVGEYTNPESAVLSAAAAEIVQSKVGSLIATLLREGKLKKA